MKRFLSISFTVFLAEAIAAPALFAVDGDRSFAAAVEKTSAAVVSVLVEKKGERIRFCGFIAAADGKIVTLGPILADADRVSVTLADGRTLRPTTINRGETTNHRFGDYMMVVTNPPDGDTLKRGLAVIGIEATDLPAVEIGDGRSAKIGDKVFVVGHDSERRAMVAGGIVLSFRDSPGVPALTISATFHGSLNGAPVLNAEGKVIGLAGTGSLAVDGQPASFLIPLKLSDAHQFSLGNVQEFNRGESASAREESDELSGDKEFIQRGRERTRADLGTKPNDNEPTDGQHDKALTDADWDWLANRHPKNSTLWVRKARALWPDGQAHRAKPDALAKALPLLRKAVVLNSDNAWAWREIASAAHGLNRPAEKIEALRALVRISPEDASRWDKLGSALLDGGKTDAAEGVFRQGLELSRDASAKTVSPAWADLCWNLAKLLARAGRVDEALSVGELAVLLNSTHSRGVSWPAAGESHPGHDAVRLALDGKTEEAIESLQAVLTTRQAEDHRFAFLQSRSSSSSLHQLRASRNRI